MKNLKEIAKEVMRKYDEMDCVVVDYLPNSSKYAIAGYPQLQDDLSVVENRTVIRKSSSKGYFNYGEAVFPVEIEDETETFVYLNIAIRTNSPRRASDSFTAHSLINNNGLVPVGMTVLRLNPEDGLYYVSQISFKKLIKFGKGELLEELLEGCKNVDFERLDNDMQSMFYYDYDEAWFIYNDSYDTKVEDTQYVVSFDDEKWRYLNSASRLGNVLQNKYIQSVRASWASTNHTYYLGVNSNGFLLDTIPSKYYYLYRLVDDNKATRRKRKSLKPKKGSVQDRISTFCANIDDSEADDYEINTAFFQKVPNLDTECIVVRVVGYHYTGYDWVREKLETARIFVEKSRITVAINADGEWVTTPQNFDSFIHSHMSVTLPEKEVFKGTKFEYLTDILEDLNQRDLLNTATLLEVLSINLFELLYSDPALKQIFLNALTYYKKNWNYNFSLTEVVVRAFGDSLNEIIKSNKRVKNLSKKKWFKLTQKQLKKTAKYNEWLRENYQYQPVFYRYGGGTTSKDTCYANMLFAIAELSPNYYSCSASDKGKFHIDNISSLSEKEFDEYLENIKSLIELNNREIFSYSFKRALQMFTTTKQQREVIDVLKCVNGDFRLILDSFDMVRSINAFYYPRRIPLLKKGLKTPRDVQEWHDDLVEVQNQINFERDRLWAEAEKRRLEAYNKAFKKRHKEWKKYETTDGEFVIKYPEKPSDLSLEGMALHHCVKSFVSKVADGATTILFIRKVEDPETPYFTMEVCDGTIRQVHGACNCNVPENSTLEKFVMDFADKHNLTHANINRMLA